MTAALLAFVLQASPDGGVLILLQQIGGPPRDEVTRLGTSTKYGAPVTVSTRKSVEDYHWSACGYEMYFHTLEVEGSDGGSWGAMLGYSGHSGCEDPLSWFDVDAARLVAGTIRITSGFAQGPKHRVGKGVTLNLVPYQDFAVPREIGPIHPRSGVSPRCLEVVERPGVHFELGGWCMPTTDAQHCLAVSNRCDVAIDAEGFGLTVGGERWEVLRGCVVPAHEHALVVPGQQGDTLDALGAWTARCPALEAAPAPRSGLDGGT